MTEISHLRALLAAATEGPWYTLGHPWRDWRVPGSILAGTPDPHAGEIVVDGIIPDIVDEDDDRDHIGQSDADMDLIVAMRNALPALLDEIEQLRVMRDDFVVARSVGQQQVEELTDEIASLRADRDRASDAAAVLQGKMARLREALEPLLPTNVSTNNRMWPDSTEAPVDVTLGDLRAARAALDETGGV